MDDQPPRCILGCCNVRSWTLTIFILSIVFLILGIITYITSFAASPGNALFGIIINVVFIYINIRLRYAVLKRNVAPIRVWLWLYSTVYILFMIVSIADVIGYIGMEDTKTRNLLIPKIVTTIAYGVFGIIFFIPVFQYYNYEKTSSSLNVMPTAGYQTI